MHLVATTVSTTQRHRAACAYTPSSASATSATRTAIHLTRMHTAAQNVTGCKYTGTGMHVERYLSEVSERGEWT